ncbi:alpha/beta fold hydrolase [Psychromicrobium lacuslunae]|uniref:AB hydrolase-1 domain-containing protein n=1 Tax=Psychromicrobium lacuslunae TaxID=1618207 RepID=A0A0D4C1U0_9MICC|nr:alpha/beta fold hydrolase [Psychromicrobium lacuslunae]AJT42543.1 hypothetical protein UM93_15535 [Psychromicrobium lacuslunae]
MTQHSISTQPGVHHSGSGPAVLFAHGAGGGFQANFAPVVESWQAQRSLIGIDYPGVGEVPRARQPLQLAELADQLVDAGIAAGFQKFPVVGLSLGSAVAITAALRHPDRVSGLILTVGFAAPDAQTELFGSLWQHFAEAGNQQQLAELILLLSAPSGVLDALDTSGLGEATAQVTAGYPSGGLEHIELVSRVNLSAQLTEIAVPTLVFAAGQDRIVLPSSTRDLAAGISGAELIEYPDAGHIFNPEQSSRWITDMQNFLQYHQL